MKIIINSLQVSKGASKGHLHPAIEIGLALKQRGHQVAIMPLPSPLSADDRDQVLRCGLTIIEPPALPDGLPLPPEELGRLAKNSDTAALAYHSFLVAPLEHQFEKVVAAIKAYKPDIIVYDLLVYAAPLAARKLNIPDIGFCAGLKLIAPDTFTRIYQTIAKQLKPDIDVFLYKFKLTAKFHHLELLSNSYQFVFTPQEFIKQCHSSSPRGTILTGALPISKPRCEEPHEYHISGKKTVVLCFGSVLDPVNYERITSIIINMSRLFNLHLFISTRHPEKIIRKSDITAESYLPLPQLIKNADIFIHHGGANTFSEALTLGVPQLLIPLTTDQPIQAEYLKQSEAGIAINPDELTEENCYQAFLRLLDKTDPIHLRIDEVRKLFQQVNGAETACELIEETAVLKVAS